MNIQQKLQELGLALPYESKPAANYVAYQVAQNFVYVSGQICLWNGKLKYTGKLGKDLDVSQGQQAAQLCGVNVLFQLGQACEQQWDRVTSCVRLNVFMQSTPEFYDHPQVANGVSDLMMHVFGESGKHTRIAVGVPALPLNSAVEVDAVFQLATPH